jgi:hypothetical protein
MSRVTFTSSIAGHADLRGVRDLLEARPVLLEQAPVEVRRDAVDQVLVQRPRRRLALVAAHHEPLALLAVVDEVVGVAQRRQVVRALVERLRHEVLVRERDDRHAHARHAPDLGGVHARRR